MRLLSLALAMAFTAGAVSMAQACPAMQNAGSSEQQIVATDKAPSTPIVIPEKPKS